MANLAGKTYGMNVVTPMRPGLTWLCRLLFMVSRSLPGTLGGLLGLSLIHFARWAIIRRDQWPHIDPDQPKQTLANDYMLFCSNFNGTWDQYVDAFADGIPGGLDLFWYCATKYPHSIPVTPFKDYIRANQIDTAYYYNATPGSAQRDIKQALLLADDLRAIAHGHDAAGQDAPGHDDAALGRVFQALARRHQGSLGAPGFAPVASCDTVLADERRMAAVAKRWGNHAAA